MKVLAFNASPRMEKGNTALILNPFLEGMRQAGAEVERFYVIQLRISPCRGCFTCWLRTPGKCAQKDDMEWILPKVRQADVIVYASPIYCYGITGPLKTLIDRMVSIASPFVEISEGRTRHLPALDEKRHKFVFVSTCGLWGMENFDAALTHMKAVTMDPPAEFAGAILRPHGEALRALLASGETTAEAVIEAAKEAGRELIGTGRISPSTLHAISRELVPMETYVQMVNEAFRKALDRGNKQSAGSPSPPETNGGA